MQKEHTLEQEKVISIDLLWFSVLADHRGKRSERIEMPEGACGNDLIDRLSRELPVIEKYRKYIRLAINQTYVDENEALNQGDEVALITPVSGG